MISSVAVLVLKKRTKDICIYTGGGLLTKQQMFHLTRFLILWHHHKCFTRTGLLSHHPICIGEDNDSLHEGKRRGFWLTYSIFGWKELRQNERLLLWSSMDRGNSSQWFIIEFWLMITYWGLIHFLIVIHFMVKSNNIAVIVVFELTLLM